MPLADGDYIKVRNHLVAALDADDGGGGLRDASGPPVKLIEAELRGEPRDYLDHEVPAIAVTVLGKNERYASGALIRTFRAGIVAYCRGLDSETEIERAMRIAARAEKVLREENAPDKQLGNLPAYIDGAVGALTVLTRSAEFTWGTQSRRGPSSYAVSASMEADVEIPCEF